MRKITYGSVAPKALTVARPLAAVGLAVAGAAAVTAIARKLKPESADSETGDGSRIVREEEWIVVTTDSEG
jgi:hypothetical protein